MTSRAYAWIIHQYHLVLNRMRRREFGMGHPPLAALAPTKRKAQREFGGLEPFEDRVMLSLTPITVTDPDSPDTITIAGTPSAISITGTGTLNQVVSEQTPLLVIKAGGAADTIKFDLSGATTSILVDGGAGVDTLDVSSQVPGMTVIKYSDGSAMLTNGSSVVRVMNVENFVGVQATITEQGMPSWLAQGPTTITGGQTLLNTQNNPVVGAINQIATDPFDPNVMFAATVGGGVWRNNDRTVFFASGSSALDATTTQIVNTYASFLKKNPGMVVQINGYTDSSGTNQLSLDRANAVANQLTAQGVQAAQLLISGNGSANPLAPNDTVANKALNERTEIIANHWTPLTDNFASTAIGSIAISSRDSLGNVVTAATPLDQLVLYAGTGMFSSNRQGAAAIGLLKSTDGGDTWALQANSDLRLLHITSVVPTGIMTGGHEIVLVSALDSTDGSKSGGIFRSTDGGLTFTQLIAGSTSALVVDPGKPDRFYAGVIGQGVFVSDGTDGGTFTLTATQPTVAAGNGANADRITLSVQPKPGSSTNVVFAELERGGTVIGVFKSTNQGAAWAQFGPVPVTGGQPDFDMSIQASADGTKVFIGGAAQGTSPYVSVLQLGDGVTWASVVKNAANGTAPHADSRSLTFDSAGRLIDANDGGVYRMALPFDAANRKWVSVNGDMAISEILSLAYDPLNNVFIVGNQDTGSSQQTGHLTDPVDLNGDGLPDDLVTRGVWQQIIQADGQGQLAVKVDATHELRFSMSNNFTYFQANLYDNAGNKVAAGSGTVGLRSSANAADRSGLGSADKAIANSNGFFTIPYVANNLNPNKMLIGLFSLYESSTQLKTIKTIYASPIGANVDTNAAPADGTAYTALTYGGMKGGVAHEDVIYAARGTKLFVRVAGAAANGFTDVSIPGSGGIVAIAMDPDDWETVYATDGTSVYMSTNHGQGWTDVSQKLNPPGGVIRSLELVKDGALKVLVAGTTAGVYRAITPAADVVWTQFGLGLPTAVVSTLHFVDRTGPSDVLAAGTQGRGAWAIYGDVASQLGTTSTLEIDGTSAADTFTIQRDPNNTLMVNIFVNSATPLLTIPYKSIQNIVIKTNGGADTLIVDSGNGGLAFPGGISFDGDAGTTVELDNGTLAAQTTNTVGPTTTYTATFVGKNQQEVISYGKNATLTNNLTPPTVAAADGAGLQNFFQWMNQLSGLPTAGGTTQPTLAMLGTSLFRAVQGAPVNASLGESDGAEATAGEAEDALDPTAAGFLRLIESGVGAFDLSKLGDSITSFADLKAALEALGATVTGSDLSSVQFQLTKTLEGEASLDTSFAFGGGTVSLNGNFGVSAQVTLNLSFGVDGTGFFVDTSASSLAINHIALHGDGEAGGRFGFLDVEAEINTLTIDPTVGLAVSLAAAGNKLRLDDLTGALGTHVVVTTTGNTGHDIALKLNVEASALIPGVDTIDLADAQLTLNWANVNSPSTATITANAGLAQDVIDFLKVNLQDVRDEIAKLTNLSDALHVNIPFVSNGLGQVLDIVNFINDKVVSPLTEAGSASFPSAQDLAERLIESLGIDPSELGFNYDAATKSLTYHLHLDQNVVNQTVNLGSGLNLADGLADLNFSTTASADANVDLDLTFGIDLAAILAGKAADQWFFIKDTSAEAQLNLAASNVNASARFGFLAINVFDGTINANAHMAISLKDPGTTAADGRIDMAELIAGLSDVSSLVAADVSGTATMQLPIKAPFLGINSSVASADNTLVVTMDFADLDNAHVEVPAAIKDVGNFAHIDAASFVGLMGQVTGWLDQFRHSDTFANFNVPLLGPALDKVLALNAAFRNSLLIDQGADDAIDGNDKLVSDINAALTTAGLDGQVHAENDGGKIKLIANDFSGTAFTLHVVGSNELGFTDGQTSSGGPQSLTATNAAPVSGILAADSTFTLTFGAGAPVSVTVKQSDTADNTLFEGSGLGNDHWKLVNADNGATFTTVDEMAQRLTQVLGVSDLLVYDATNSTLTFTLALDKTFGQIDLPLNFNVDLQPLLSLSSNSSLRLTADGSLDLTVGVYLGDTPRENMLDTNKLLTAVNGGVQNKTDLVITGTQDVRTVFGQLTNDASFDLSVNGGAVHTVAITKTAAADNTTAANLAADINAALAADFSGTVQAIADGNRIVLVGIGTTTAIHLTASNANPAVTDIGFAASQDAVNDGGTWKIKATKDLSTLYGRLTGDATFNVSLDGGAPVAVTILKTNTDTNRFTFDIVNDVQSAINAIATLNGKITVGFANNRLTFTAVAGTTSFSMTAAGTAATELGLGASNTGNSNEFNILTRDGSTLGINLDGVTTLGDLLAAIGAQTGGKVTATINSKGNGINLNDNTSGAGTFQVLAANNSTAATTLGILRPDAQQGETPDGLIEGANIADISPSDRFFLQNVDAEVGLHLTTPTGVNLGAQVGFLGVNLSGNGVADADLSVKLKDPGTTAADGRISLTELFHGLSNVSTLLDAPTLTGGGTMSLGVSVTPTIPGLVISSDPVVLNINSWGNPFTGDAPDVSVTIPDDLVAFNNPDFSFANILAGLKALADFLGQFQSFGFLSTPIPLINVSVKDLISLADKFNAAVTQAQADPAGTVQVLKSKLKEAFGIPQASNLLDLSLFTDPTGGPGGTALYLLRITVDLKAGFDKSLPFNFDLGAGLSLGGSGGLDATGDLDVKLDFGLNLQHFDLAHPLDSIYLFDGTGVTATLNANATNLNFKAAIGPAGIFVKDGSAAFAAAFSGGVDAGLFSDHHVTLGSLLSGGVLDGINVDLSGSIHATLPVYFPIESKHTGDITFDWNDLSKTDPNDANGPKLVVPPNLLTIDPSQFSILDQLGLGVDGIDFFLGGLQDALDGSIGGVNLPLIGDKLSSAATAIGDFRNSFIDPLRQAIDDFANPSAEFAKGGTDPISKILFKLLGSESGGLGLLQDSNNDHVVDIHDIMYDGNVSDPNISLADLFVHWHFKLGGTIVSANPGIGLDLGIPGLGLETSGHINIQIVWSLNFGFGLNYHDGFFLDIGSHNELNLSVDVTVPNGSITGTLGFLQFTATDHEGRTHLGATFGIDIFNGKNSSDDKLSFSELGNLAITPVIGAEAVIDLDAKLSLSSDLIPGAATNFPSIVAEFVLEWHLGDRGAGTLVPITQLKGNFLSSGLQFVGFKNVGLDLGSYFSDFIEPIVHKIQEYTAPVKPFLDFITAPLPIISDLAGPTSLLDIAALSGDVSPEFVNAIEFIDKIVGIADQLANTSITGNAILKFGTGEFDIYNPGQGLDFDLTSPGSISDALAGDKIHLPSWLDLGGLDAALAGVSSALKGAIDSMNAAAADAPKTTLSLPIINDPAQIFGLLLGKHAKLIELDLAPFDITASFSAFFSLLGPLGVSINADFAMHIKFDFGYDTLGIEEFAKGGFKNPLLLADGFFVGITDADGHVIPQLTFDAGLWAAAELNLGIARGGVGGGLFAQINFTLHDPDLDGRVRIKEIVTDILNEVKYGDPALSPLAIFDITGDLEARLFAFLKIDLGFFSLDEKWDITKPIVLLKFDSDFFRAPTLATELGDGVLQLNMGANAAQRIEGDLTDNDEHFFVKQGGDSSHVLVWAPDLGIDEAHAQEYLLTSTLIADGGKGNDTIDASGVTEDADFDLQGGVGDDILKAGVGHGNAKILGGTGDDMLFGGDGDDIIFGEGGADEIHGLGGNDLLLADGDPKTSIQDNIITGGMKATDGNDKVFGDDGVDLIIGGGGDDELHGGAGNDTIIGDDGMVTIDNSRNVTAVEQTDKGKGGKDNIFGDAGDDLVYAGFGSDTVDGGADNDVIYGETGFDTIQGGSGNDLIHGGNDDDTINAGAGNDYVYGEAGNDTINAQGDDDWVYGGEGTDTIHGDDGADHLFGNGGSDQLSGDTGDDYLEGGGGDDVSLGGDGHDTLVGGYGSDQLDGQADGDTYLISSRGGPTDQLTTAYDSGSTGNDILIVTGTAGDDTFLLRSMADYYFDRYYPTVGKVTDALAATFNDASIPADKMLDSLKKAVEDAYGSSNNMFVVPAGMIDALEAAFTATPNNLNSLKNAITGKYIDSGLALIYSLVEPILSSSLADADKLANVKQAITDAYGTAGVPAGMFAALDAADITSVSSTETAIASNYTTLRSDTGFVALLNNGGANVERFNYQHMEGLTLNTIQGNDYVVLDDVIAATTINMGLGNDRAQIGQVFNSARVGNFDQLVTNINPVDAFGTLAITRGWLSNGVSAATTINGGDGNDEFTVFHNTAVLNLNGGDGDDLFTIRAFALLGSIDSQRARTDIKGDAGADTILYVVNAPVNVDGGDGFDTVKIVGTEFSDDFVVTDAGVFGAGLNVNYVNIEKLIADGAEGNDRFFVLSTGIDVVTELDGGLGNDTFFVGGTPQNGPIPVISNDFKGYNGVVLNSVESTDAQYNGITADGVSANVVDDEQSAIIVTESGGVSRVTEDAPLASGEGYYFDSYTVRLSRAPVAGTEVHVHPIATGIAPEDEAKGYKDIEFLDGANNVIDPELVFTDANWNLPQTVRFRATHDLAQEGTRYTFINHTVFDGTTDPLYATAKLLSVKVQINDDDKAGVVVTPTGLNNTVLEGGFTDTFDVVLTRPPTADVTVTLTTVNGQVTLDKSVLTFTPGNYNVAQTVTMTANDDAVVEGFHTDYITYSVASADVNTDVAVSSYLVNGDFDLGTFASPLEIPADKPTSYLFLQHRPDLTQPITVLYDADGAGGGGADVTLAAYNGESDSTLRYSIDGNTIEFYKDGSPVSISGAVHISYSFVNAGYNNAVVKDSVVDIYDNDAAGVIVTQSNGSTDLIEGDPATDSYTVVLTKAPTAGTTVTVNLDSIKTRSTSGTLTNFATHVFVNGALSSTLTFDSTNWNIAQTVTVSSINDNYVDGDDTQVFAPELQTTHKIRGPLILQGASGAGSLSLPIPLTLPGERNVRPFDGQVVDFTAGAGEGATEFMTVKKADLLAKLPDFALEDPPITTIAQLAGKTIELTEGPGTGVILDPTRPGDVFNRFWLIIKAEDLGNGNVKLTLQNPTAVNPSLANVTAPTAATRFAVTSLSVNFFADEKKSIDYVQIFDNDSVANENGALTSSTGNVLAFASVDGTTDSMTVKTSDLQAIGSLNNNLNLLIGKTIQITVGPGLARTWTIAAIADGAVAGTKVLTLTKSPGGSGSPTDRSEFLVDGGDTRGRITGFGMGPNVVIGGAVQSGAITYGDMETLQMNLGKGNDTVRVDYTTNAEDHTTKRSGDFYTLTTLNTGDGNDNVTLNLQEGKDGDIAVNLGAGDDTASAAASTLPVTIFGWTGNDTITGGSGADTIFGDIGRVDYVNGDGTIITRLGQALPLSAVNPPVVAATATTLTDNVTNGGSPFSTDFGGLAGLVVQAISPKGFVQYRTIVSNTANTITISKPWDTLPDSTWFYRISTLPEDQTDGTFRGPRVAWSIMNDQGGNDTINGGGGNDLLVGGWGNDTVDSGSGTDWVAGDDARFDFTPINGTDGATRLVTFADPLLPGDDTLIGGDDPDILIGGLGNDTIYGNGANDLLIGDAAVLHFAADGSVDKIETTNRDAGGVDTIDGGVGDDIVIGGTNADNLDGGAGRDLIFGDNVTLNLNPGHGDAISPRYRALTGSVIYSLDGTAQVGSTPMTAPGGNPGWADFTIQLDQTTTNFGNDYIAGGAGNDEIFGQLGDDIIQGDGSISLTVSKTLHSTDDAAGANTDGDDYIEGNAGSDTIFGNLGQDDIIGGSSSLFSLNTPALRSDGSDFILGGSGTQIARNDPGQTGATAHARDADMILADNGNIYRIVGVNGSSNGQAPVFTYDNYTNALPAEQQLNIVVRAAELLDYTPGGIDVSANANNDIGGNDEVHGEGGDDFIFGQKGSDALFGDGQDDDIIGGYGNDWISGGTGQDGIIGDDGTILTSRNGFSESLNGIVAIPAAQLNLTIATGGKIQSAIINIANALTKAMNLTPFSTDTTWTGTADEFGGVSHYNNDDIIFGGLGDDFLHGGSGDDAISGGEALTESYAPTYDANGIANGFVEIDFSHPNNPGNVLRFNPMDPNSKNHSNGTGLGQFALYDEFDPMRQILLTNSGTLSKTGSGKQFFLNSNVVDGPLDAIDAAALQKHSDGNDAIFGDNGNDWIVGGTGRDDLYGGWGNDLLNADDDQTTAGGLNNVPDTAASYEDRAYGGAGKDVLIGNTGGDRLIDWVGEFNSYLVPFAPFGMATVSRTVQPALPEFLYALSRSDGADFTRALDMGTDPLRNGEPAGELGMVIQKDKGAWQNQTGAPSDPQPGNTGGTARDVLRTSNLSAGAAVAFFADTGSWSSASNAYVGTSAATSGDAVSLFNLDQWLRSYYEVLASIKLSTTAGTGKQVGFIIFDYQSPTDFKYAGLDAINDVLRIGQRTSAGWIDKATVSARLNANSVQSPTLAVNGATATLTLGKSAVSFTFSDPLNDGMIGLGTYGGECNFLSLQVQQLPVNYLYNVADDFSDGVANDFTPGAGTWTTTSGTAGRYSAAPVAGVAISTKPFVVAPLSYTEYSATVNARTNGTLAGLVFGYSDTSNFFYAGIVAGTNQAVIGHRAGGVWVTDAVSSKAIAANTNYALLVSLEKNTVNLVLNGATVASFTYNVLPNQGRLGLFTKDGAGSFDNLLVRGDDPMFAATPQLLTAASVPAATAVPAPSIQTWQLTPIITAAYDRWARALGVSSAVLKSRYNLSFMVGDLSGSALSEVSGNSVIIDVNAAGNGWYVDPTPKNDSEFRRRHGALVAASAQAGKGVDLLTAVMHEIGHAIGLDHSPSLNNLMFDTLSTGVRRLPAHLPHLMELLRSKVSN